MQTKRNVEVKATYHSYVITAPGYEPGDTIKLPDSVSPEKLEKYLSLESVWEYQYKGKLMIFIKDYERGKYVGKLFFPENCIDFLHLTKTTPGYIQPGTLIINGKQIVIPNCLTNKVIRNIVFAIQNAYPMYCNQGKMYFVKTKLGKQHRIHASIISKCPEVVNLYNQIKEVLS